MRNILGKEILFNQIDEKIPNKLFFLFLIDALCFTFTYRFRCSAGLSNSCFHTSFLGRLREKLSLNNSYNDFSGLGNFSLFYAGFDTNNLFELRHRVGLVFASITFIALIYYLMEFSKKILMLAIVVNFFGVVWHFFLPDSFIVIGELL